MNRLESLSDLNYGHPKTSYMDDLKLSFSWLSHIFDNGRSTYNEEGEIVFVDKSINKQTRTQMFSDPEFKKELLQNPYSH